MKTTVPGERATILSLDSGNFIHHCSMKELYERHCVIKWVDELRDEIAAMLVEGDVILRSSVCPHFGGEFDFSGTDGMLNCKWHGWKFDARTGVCRNYKTAAKLRAYPFEIVDGMVLVKID